MSSAALAAGAVTKGIASPNDTLRVAVIGLGSRGPTAMGRGKDHIQTWAKIPNTEMVAICDIDDAQIAKGLKLFETVKFDVVVTDFRMPGMDGRELIARIRKQDPDARVILLSGFVEPLGLTEQSTGADAVIAKSCNEVAQLVRSVKRLVNRGGRKPLASQKAMLAPTRAAGG